MSIGRGPGGAPEPGHHRLHREGAGASIAGVPVIAGGLEAGPRRLAYWDYWDERFRRSILVDSKADLLVWGMGERQIVELARRIGAGESLGGLAGTCEVVRVGDVPEGARVVPSFEALAEDDSLLVDLFDAVREENSPSSRSWPRPTEIAGSSSTRPRRPRRRTRWTVGSTCPSSASGTPTTRRGAASPR